MRASKGIGLPILAIIVGLSMIVGAVAIIRLSNVVENNNTVELPVVLQLKSTTATPGGDLPDYMAGSVVLGVTYDTQVSYTTSKAPTDVTMKWAEVSVWNTIVWTDSGDSLRGTLGIVGTQPAGATVNYYATLSYNVLGAFNFKVWVEGSLA